MLVPAITSTATAAITAQRIRPFPDTAAAGADVCAVDAPSVTHRFVEGSSANTIVIVAIGKTPCSHRVESMIVRSLPVIHDMIKSAIADLPLSRDAAYFPTPAWTCQLDRKVWESALYVGSSGCALSTVNTTR